MPNYADIRPQMKTGDLLLWRNHKGGPTIGYLERFIVQAGTMSPYIHVGMCWVEGGAGVGDGDHHPRLCAQVAVNDR